MARIFFTSKKVPEDNYYYGVIEFIDGKYHYEFTDNPYELDTISLMPDFNWEAWNIETSSKEEFFTDPNIITFTYEDNPELFI